MMQKQDKWRLSKMITHSPLLLPSFLPSFLSAISTFHPRPSSLFIASGSTRGRKDDRPSSSSSSSWPRPTGRPLLPICKRSKEVGSIAAVTNFGHDNYLLTYGREKQSLRRRRDDLWRRAERQKAAKSKERKGNPRSQTERNDGIAR